MGRLPLYYNTDRHFHKTFSLSLLVLSICMCVWFLQWAHRKHPYFVRHCRLYDHETRRGPRVPQLSTMLWTLFACPVPAHCPRPSLLERRFYGQCLNKNFCTFIQKKITTHCSIYWAVKILYKNIRSRPSSNTQIYGGWNNTRIIQNVCEIKWAMVYSWP